MRDKIIRSLSKEITAGINVWFGRGFPKDEGSLSSGINYCGVDFYINRNTGEIYHLDEIEQQYTKKNEKGERDLLSKYTWSHVKDVYDGKPTYQHKFSMSSQEPDFNVITSLTGCGDPIYKDGDYHFNTCTRKLFQRRGGRWLYEADLAFPDEESELENNKYPCEPGLNHRIKSLEDRMWACERGFHQRLKALEEQINRS